MNTTYLLLAQYNGCIIVPVRDVVRDYFDGLTVERFTRKVDAGEIAIPLVRLYDGHKAPKGVHVVDLACYLDARRAAAVKECQALNGLNK